MFLFSGQVLVKFLPLIVSIILQILIITFIYLLFINLSYVNLYSEKAKHSNFH